MGSQFHRNWFFEGEPLMAKENINLLRYCVEQGFSKNISILLNTNGMVFHSAISDLKYGKFSLQEQFNYIFNNNKIHAINIFECFIEKSINGHVEYFWPIDGHNNSTGYNEWANCLFDFMLQKNILNNERTNMESCR